MSDERTLTWAYCFESLHELRVLTLTLSFKNILQLVKAKGELRITSFLWAGAKSQ